MTKDFKFDTDSSVWLMHRNKVIQGVVGSIVYAKHTSPLKEIENYTVKGILEEAFAVEKIFSKDQLFHTKEELLASL